MVDIIGEDEWSDTSASDTSCTIHDYEWNPTPKAKEIYKFKLFKKRKKHDIKL